MRARLVRALFLVLAFGLGAGAWVLPVAAQPALDSLYVEAAVAALPTRRAETIWAFYAARSYSPVWTAEVALSAHGRALRVALSQADRDGLDPADYVLPDAITGRAESVEVASADAFLHLANDLARGRVDPVRVHDDWDARRRRLDLEELLRLAASRGPEVALQTARPSHEGYARLRDALARYRVLASDGEWPTIPPGPVLRLGDTHPAVALLRRRLTWTGDLVDRAPQDSVEHYDTVLEEVVRRAQARHGLVVDGAVGPATRAALNVSAAARAAQIALNMERWRWLPADLGPTHLHINAAGMMLELAETGEATLWLRTIVGTLGNPTPGFSSVVTHAVFNPYWYVPESIARTEIWPRLARDPGYLARHHMRVLPNGRIRQAPGPDNPLGPVKFIFENRFGVRLHGTSAPALFQACVRAFSHGCIRVEEPIALATRLLGPAWDADRVREVVEEKKERWVRLPEPVPIHVAYWTAWVEDDGTMQFRDDLYGRDLALARALGLLGRTSSLWQGPGR